MARQARASFAILMSLLLVLGPLTAVGNAQTGGTSVAGASASNVGKYGVTPMNVETSVGKITTVSPSSLPGKQDSDVSPRYAEQCHKQLVIMQYNDDKGEPTIKFIGVHEWCFDGQEVTRNSMPVVTWIRPAARYQPGQDGYRYVASALKSTDHYLTYRGHWHGAQRNTRLGRFEYREHGISKPIQVLLPFVSRVGRYDGTCTGPLPSDRSPRVVSVKPANGSKGVLPSANVEATFFSRMNPATINDDNFYLQKKGSGIPIGATIRYDAATKTATLNPRKNLSPGATYEAQVFNGPYGVLSAVGDPIEQLKSVGWSFTVAR